MSAADHIRSHQIMGLYDLDALHITHRDLKPENILVARNGRLLIADFGCASTEPKMWKAHGTRQYRSPEMQDADPEREEAFYDRRADLYALGLLIIEMFRGTVRLILFISFLSQTDEVDFCDVRCVALGRGRRLAGGPNAGAGRRAR